MSYPNHGHGHSFTWMRTRTRTGFQLNWTLEPSRKGIRVISRILLNLPHSVQPKIKLMSTDADGSSRLYTVSYGGQSYVLRVILGVEAGRKTLSEVTTMDFARRKFHLPVPDVLGFDIKWQNHVEFEYIALGNVAGMPLRECWEGMSWSSKEALVKKLAAYTATMFQRKFDRIGSLMPDKRRIHEGIVGQLVREDDIPKEPKGILAELLTSLNRICTGAVENEIPPYYIDEVVSKDFFWGERSAQDVPHGPFQSSADWITARLCILETERIAFLMHSNDSSTNDKVATALQAIRRLKKLVSRFYDDGPEDTVLSLTHLTFDNILINDSVLTCLADWECVSVLPLWKACDFPSFLESRERTTPPHRSPYISDPDEADRVHSTQALEHELTRLRGVFVTELERLEPRWVRESAAGGAQREFELAVRHCDGEMYLGEMERWLDQVEAEEASTLSLSPGRRREKRGLREMMRAAKGAVDSADSTYI